MEFLQQFCGVRSLVYQRVEKRSTLRQAKPKLKAFAVIHGLRVSQLGADVDERISETKVD